jgi:type VI secretion system protein ImpH
MADDSWTAQHPLEDSAQTSTGRQASSLFQVLRRIECEHRAWPRLGEAFDPAQEGVRLGQDPSLAFEGSAIVSDRAREGAASRLGVSFFGVFGPNGPMPLHLSEYAQQRLHSYRDPTLARFVDIFHHRLISLFYRAWANAQPVISHDRPEDDPILRYVGALAGQATRLGELTAPDNVLPYMARHFLGQTRHPEGLANILRERFCTNVTIEEFVGEWLQVPDEYCWRLSSGKPETSAMGVLGTSTRVGTAVWERQFKFRVVLGPLTRTQYERFLPKGDLMAQLVTLVQRYVGHELSWDVRLLLQETEQRPTVLGRSGRIGQTSYVGTPAAAGPAAEAAVVLNPLAQAS